MNEGEQIELLEIQLEQSTPAWFRICVFGAAFFVLIWQFCALISEGGTRYQSYNADSIIMILFCGAIIGCVLFGRNVRWTIRNDEIRIDKGWIYEYRKVVLINSGEIAKIKVWTVAGEDSADSYFIQLWLTSGENFESPPMKDAYFARQLGTEIERRLNVPIEGILQPIENETRIREV